MQTPSTLEALLGHWKVPFEALPTGDHEQSDYLVRLGRSSFLFEEKTKLDDPNETIRKAEELRTTWRSLTVKPLVRRNRLSAIVKKAASQLESSASRLDHDYKLVWFNGAGAFAAAHVQQFIATIYGKTGVTGMHLAARVPCYFYDHSDFFKHATSIDGAVAVTHTQSGVVPRLCLNPLSPNYHRLRRTKFARLFGNAVEDPMKLERQRRAFILDTSVDRSDESAVLRAIEKKYGTGPLMPFNIGYHQFSVRVTSEA